jgi:hypothetical protein
VGLTRNAHYMHMRYQRNIIISTTLNRLPMPENIFMFSSPTPITKAARAARMTCDPLSKMEHRCMYFKRVTRIGLRFFKSLPVVACAFFLETHAMYKKRAVTSVIVDVSTIDPCAASID